MNENMPDEINLMDYIQVITTLATKKVTIYTEILLSCEYCVEQNLLPRAHLRGIFNRHGNH